MKSRRRHLVCHECGHSDGSPPNPSRRRPLPRWDQDEMIIARGWLEGRCGRCGSQLDGVAEDPAPLDTPGQPREYPRWGT
jgi:hypothetical protein